MRLVPAKVTALPFEYIFNVPSLSRACNPTRKVSSLVPDINHVAPVDVPIVTFTPPVFTPSEDPQLDDLPVTKALFIRASPLTSSVYEGFVTPIPTFPPVKIPE